jgi:hypothetical protein
VHAFEANTPFEKLPGTQINVPRLNLHKRPRHRRCPASHDFVPWRFSDAGRRSAWIASSCRHPKTCTKPDVLARLFLDRKWRATADEDGHYSLAIPL